MSLCRFCLPAGTACLHARRLALPVLLTQQHLVDKGPPAHQAEVICVDTDVTIALESAEDLDTSISGSNLAYATHTSGSTGRPKGVMISHRGVVNYLSWCTNAYAVQQGSGSPVHSPLGFDLTVTSLLAPLTVGQSVLLSMKGRELRVSCWLCAIEATSVLSN